jgi:hypothetical protein
VLVQSLAINVQVVANDSHFSGENVRVVKLVANGVVPLPFQQFFVK